jgi:NAD(P)-dependent dehydrogenase (short-subunit alcohol dehydrogenase family)
MTTTLITGANRGIGLALAKQAAAAGHTVIGTARDPGSAVDLRNTGARVLRLDAADPASVDAFATELAGKPVDILINNGAIFPDRSGLEGTNLDQFEATLRVNVRGPLAVTRALLPNLRAGERKTVATISSSMGSIAGTKSGGSYAYRVSKASVNMLMRAMAAEIDDLVFLAIDPGWVRTDMGGDDAALSPDESAAGVFTVASDATREQSGLFFRHDGERLDW